jgi:hypothetical protein
MDRQPLTDRLGDRLLAEYGGAAAAYSLRALNGNGDSVVRVRRASDNDEKDFTALQVSSGELTNWVNSQIVPPLDIGVETSEGRIPVPEGGTSIGTPAAAYSLRNLSTTYTGNVVDVRRSSDDAEDSFTAAEVADGTLADWVSEVVTAYTQTVDLNIPAGNNLYVTLPSYGTFNSIGKRYRVTFELKRNSGGAGTTGSSPSLLTLSTWVYSNATYSSNLDPKPNRFDINQATEDYQTYTVTFTTDTGSSPLRFRTFDINDSYTVRNFTTEIIGQDGFVSKWYDQSGNDNHATQGTAASQPKIVDGGTLVTGGIDFDGVDDVLITSLVPPNVATLIGVANWDIEDQSTMIIGARDSVNQRSYLAQTSSGQSAIGVSSSALPDVDIVAGDDYLLFGVHSGLTRLLSTNGSVISDSGGSAPNNTIHGYSVGALNTVGTNGSFMDGTLAEVIVYPSDQSNNRTAIEANIGETYGITGIPAYDNTVDGFVETWYDQSGNGNDATQSVAASQPKIVDAGVLVSGDTGEPAFTGDGVDDILSLSSSINFGTGEFFVSTVVDVDNTGGVVIGSASPNWMLLVTTSSIQVRSSNTNTIYIISPDSVLTAGESYLISLSRVENDITAYVNGVAQADVETVVSTDTFSADRFLQRGTNGNPYPDPVSEVIIYASDQSANRVAIETNINDHYNIY